MKPVTESVARGVTALEICSDWVSEIEMPGGWVATSDEVSALRDALRSVERLEESYGVVLAALKRLTRAMSLPGYDAERANALLQAQAALNLGGEGAV